MEAFKCITATSLMHFIAKTVINCAVVLTAKMYLWKDSNNQKRPARVLYHIIPGSKLYEMRLMYFIDIKSFPIFNRYEKQQKILCNSKNRI